MEPENTINVLLIEDNPGNARLITELISEPGNRSFALTHAESLASGLARLKESLFDCILLDLNLPDGQGVDLYQKIRAQAPETAIVALTGSDDEQIALTLLRQGIQDYLTKEQVTTDLLHRTICYAQDRIRATKELISSEYRFRSCMNNISDAVLVVDADGFVRFINPAGKSLFQTRSDAFLGEPFGFPVTMGDSIEIALLARTGTPVIAEMRVTQIEWEGKPASLASIRDITERKTMENALTSTSNNLKQSMVELEAANKKILAAQKSIIEEERLKVLLQMAGATAHELNQPLFSMLGNIELLNDPENTPEEVKNFINEIDVAGKRIANIVKKIQTIRHDETTLYAEGSQIIDFDQKLRILSIEDSDVDFEMIRNAINEMHQVVLSRAVNIEKGLEKINRETFDLVLLDYILPDGSASDFLQTMHENNIKTPVIIVSGKGDELIVSQIIRQGASDYLPKNRVTKEILSRVIKTTIEKTRLQIEISLAQDRMAEMATKDELTGLYNRRFCLDALKNEIAKNDRNSQFLVLSMMDLDNFKQINDAFGHAAGDMVLSEFAKILKENFREVDIICRYGGEEFVVIMPYTRTEDGSMACERLRKKVSLYPFEYNKTRFQVTVSTGVVEYIEMMDLSGDDLIKRADAAMYQAKKEGRNCIKTIGQQLF